MSVLVVYLRIYRAALAAALASTRKSPWTLLLPVALLVGILLAGGLAAALGFLGGILLSLALAALASSYLYFVGELCAKSKVSLTELEKSFGRYFWAVINVLFIIWIAELLVGMALARSPDAGIFFLALRLLEFVLLNATPEVIYQKRTYGGMATLQESVRFIHANWIEWFAPNLLLGAAFYFGVPPLIALGVPVWVVGAVGGAVLHVAMIFRGVLFSALDGSSHRQRMFKYQTH